jgi:hypothetical protein
MFPHNQRTCPPHFLAVTIFTVLFLQSTLRTIHSTERHLNRLGQHTPRYQPLPHFTQPRTRINLAPVLPTRVLRTTPQHLRSRTSTRPDHAIQVHTIRLLRPDVRLAADHEVRFVGGDACQRVVAVHHAPVVAREAVVVVRPELRRRRCRKSSHCPEPQSRYQ